MKKILILVVCLFLISGCNATYNVEIKDKKVIEKFEFIENNNLLLNSEYVKSDFGEDGLILYKNAIEQEYKKESYTSINSVNNFYNKKKILNDGLGIKYKYTFDIDNYNNSTIANNGFKYFSVLTEEDETYIISTSSGAIAFDEYEYLDNLTIHLKTNHKVKNNNADRVDNYNYYWEINKSNYKDKKIYIELYKDKYIFNYENNLVKIGIIILSIAILSVIVIIIFRQKSKKNNRI